MSETMERIIRLGEVKHITGLSRTTIYRMIADREFPGQIQIGANAVGWRKSEIDAWIASLQPVPSIGALDRH